MVYIYTNKTPCVTRTNTSAVMSYNEFKLLILVLMVCRTTSCDENNAVSEDSQNVTKVIQRLLQKTTNKLFRPYASGKAPVIVKTDIKLMSIGTFREADMQYTVEMYFRQSWKDPRLRYDDSDVPSITLNGDLSDSFWQPDTIFENEVEGKVHTLLAKNKFYRIHRDGLILTSTRLTLTCSCSMDFRKFPMDEQECGIYLVSYGYTTQDIVYEWQTKHETWSNEQDIPQFLLKNISRINITRRYSTGDYSALGIKMRFTRRLGHYFTKVYIPAILIVMLSWLSFYVDRRSAPARVSLGITTVLTMTTLLIGIGQGSLPVVAYVKALDWYLFVSYFMVFAAFAEYAVINYRDGIYRRSKTEKRLEENGSTVSHKDTESIDNSTGYSNGAPKDAFDFIQESTPKKYEVTSKKKFDIVNWFTQKFLTPPEVIDAWAKILFPLTYVIFNFLYWMYYLVIIE
ncbi:glycine receptor subunit alpha-2 [Exaiptasia diaphana]|uniref:Uncharacterized protein n=1 Tax=Exaiptasia diaphana TaxID=2652724 RepID=A0A913X3R6_EXADI|nr:glycine receptor subunit alpha-2 [Exaiptasia diaphana]